MGIALSVPFEYRQLAGTNTYIAGANLGIPINIIQMKRDSFGWRLTPFGSTWGAFSDNLVAGGFFVTGGAVSSLRYRIGSFQATLMNQATYNGGVPLSPSIMSATTLTSISGCSRTAFNSHTRSRTRSR